MDQRDKKDVNTLVSECLTSLPAPEYFASYTSSLYGADYHVAEYLGFKCPPARIPGTWVHGWGPAHQNIDPAIVIGRRCSHEFEKDSGLFWVARRDQEEYLRSCGYRNAKAIGLAVAYLPKKQFTRIKGSLLVMPVHTLDYTTGEWNFEEYADEIKKIESRFSQVVVCVHPSCWKKGYWVDAFKRRGFTVIPGNAADDRNSLRRLQILLSSFEYMTTNGFGSHLVYGAYFGSKVSIYGPYAEYQLSDFENDRVYRNCPQLVSRLLETITESAIRHHYPFLFCDPERAEANQDWGSFEVGDQCRVAPDELRRLFRWDAWNLWKRQMRINGRTAIGLMSRITPRPIKESVKRAIGYRA